MRKPNKLVALIFAILASIAMLLPASAYAATNDNSGSITINDAEPGHTYNAYQVLVLESYDAKAGAYSYKANAKWAEWLKTQTQYVAIDGQGYVTWEGRCGCRSLRQGRDGHARRPRSRLPPPRMRLPPLKASVLHRQVREPEPRLLPGGHHGRYALLSRHHHARRGDGGEERPAWYRQGGQGGFDRRGVTRTPPRSATPLSSRLPSCQARRRELRPARRHVQGPDAQCRLHQGPGRRLRP